MALAYFPLVHLAYWLREGGTVFTAEVLLIPLAPIGVWISFTAFRRGRYLAVESTAGTRRFAFASPATASDIDGFVRAIEQAFELTVSRGTWALSSRRSPPASSFLQPFRPSLMTFYGPLMTLFDKS